VKGSNTSIDWKCALRLGMYPVIGLSLDWQIGKVTCERFEYCPEVGKVSCDGIVSLLQDFPRWGRHPVTGLLLDLKIAQRLGRYPVKGSSVDYID